MGGTHSAVQPDDSLQGSGAVRPSSSFGVVWKGACSTSCGTIGSMLIVGLVEFIEFRLRSPSRFQAHSTRIARCTINQLWLRATPVPTRALGRRRPAA